MSLDINGRTIRCDGEGAGGTGCVETTLSVISLRPRPGAQPEGQDWVYVRIGNVWRHYCPGCARHYLNTLNGHLPGTDTRDQTA